MWETVGMANRKKRIPRKGDRVTALGRGAFVVFSIDVDLRTAELKPIGRALALRAVPWSALTFLDELDSSQNAMRIVRESTEGK